MRIGWNGSGRRRRARDRMKQNISDVFKRIYESYVEKNIRQNFPLNEFTNPVYYMLGFPRNFFRAALPIIIARMFNERIIKFLPISTSSEIIYAISLVQDDIIDNDKKRNNKFTAWKKFGLSHCIASIDYSYYHVIKIINQLKDCNINKERLKLIYRNYLESHKVLNESFILEERNKFNFDISLENLLKIYEYKTITGTNALFCSALIAKGLSINDCEKFKRYAIFVAYAGQIKNDILDYFPLKGYEEYRKLSDFKKGYINYPIIKFFRECSISDKKILMNKFGKTPEKVVDLLNKYDISKECMNDCSMFINKALEQISDFENSKEKNIFEDWANSNKKFGRINWP